MKMKKVLLFVLVFLLAVALCACGSKKPSSSENGTEKETESETIANAKKKDYEAAAKAFMDKIMSEDYDEAYEMLKTADEPFISEQDFEDYIPKSSLNAFAGSEMKLSSAETKIGDVSVTVTLKYGAETVVLDMAEEGGKIVIDYDEFAVRKWYIKAFDGVALTLNGVSVNDNAKGTVADGLVTYKLNYVPNRTVLIEMETAFGKKVYRATPENGAEYDLAQAITIKSFDGWTVSLDDAPLDAGKAADGRVTYLLPCDSGEVLKGKLTIDTPLASFERKMYQSSGAVIDFAEGFDYDEVTGDSGNSVLYNGFSDIYNSLTAHREMGVDEFTDKYISKKLPEYDRKQLGAFLYQKMKDAEAYPDGIELTAPSSMSSSGAKTIVPLGNDLYQIRFKLHWSSCKKSGSAIFSCEDGSLRFYECESVGYLEPTRDPDFK